MHEQYTEEQIHSQRIHGTSYGGHYYRFYSNIFFSVTNLQGATISAFMHFSVFYVRPRD